MSDRSCGCPVATICCIRFSLQIHNKKSFFGLQVGAHFAKDAFSSFVVNPLGNAVQDQVHYLEFRVCCHA